MNKSRLDQELVKRGLVSTRSQAENYIKLGYARVNGKSVNKSGTPVSPNDDLKIDIEQQYVSRAALKLASVAASLGLDFSDKIILDVGSSTGGFTDYALKHGARRVIAVDVGSEQMHPSLRDNPAVELHENTDIRDVRTLSEVPDMIIIDVSFISIRAILPTVAGLSNSNTQIIAMVKPQFEAEVKDKNKGVVKNDNMRRRILREFEAWAKQHFVIIDKADSEVAGAKGNLERFYLLRVQKKSSGR